MKVLLIDNGSSLLEKLKELIGAEVITKNWSEVSPSDYIGYDLIVLSGSRDQSVVWKHDQLTGEIELLKNTKIPVIGICFGCELIAYAFGGELKELPARHEGIREIEVLDKSLSLRSSIKVYEHHHWIISKIPNDFIELARSADGSEAIKHKSRPIYGLQFHPENMVESAEGYKIFNAVLVRCPGHAL